MVRRRAGGSGMGSGVASPRAVHGAHRSRSAAITRCWHPQRRWLPVAS